ncbi:tetratricopeptide repeat family protein [Burkholderia pseudomallei MSHR5613]|uniref:hypothetical protein n=1 Tax=Burkholderia pseudomallei TaxID=28450 RepID=UPI000531CDB2|nr:hypothetical protein [Burkholderia pseudomallei]KGS52868.1 tetratricopeptide repeat family protein [Burkholderia pseudomallei MSHR5613]
MGDYLAQDARIERITVRDPEARTWFDRGLLWAYGFNFEAAVDCFQEAARIDPDCVLAYWGIAYASGCNYNKQWKVFHPRMIARCMKLARDAIRRAQACRAGASALEMALVRAIECRFQAEGAHDEALLRRWNDDYARAMRDVYLSCPDNLDVAALFADALINRTPWKLWDMSSGKTADGADTDEAIAVLERALAQVDANGLAPHPGLLHVYIHTIEMSPTPEKALRAADTLRDLAPDVGHLLHMASHIDILCGHYHDAIVANDRAIAANQRVLDRHPQWLEFRLYCVHDIHFKIYAAMMLGRFSAAWQGVLELEALITEALLRVEQPPMAYLLEGFLSVRVHVLIRFGKWREILEQPFPANAALYCNTTAMLHYARGIAYANLKLAGPAAQARRAFSIAQAALHEHRYVTNNTCADLLKIAACVLDGEIAYHEDRFDEAFAHLRRAVELDDGLEYMEPWGWMMPTRHPLGALLLAQGHVEEAERVYRADLGLDSTIYRSLQHPGNVWSLQGYVSCLRRLGKHETADALQPALDVARARADVEIGVSCFCAAPSKRGCCH